MQHNNLELDDFVMLEDTSKTPTPKKKTNFPALSNKALTQLWKMVAIDPDKLVYQNTDPEFTVYRFNDLYVVPGKTIGEGFWGVVALGTQYEKDADEPIGHCVLKTLKQKNFFGRWLDRTLNTNEKLIEESMLVAKMHANQSDSLVIETSGSKKTFIMLPYLGATSLASVLKNTYALEHIPCQQWLQLFETLMKKLRNMHRELGRLHNDIKPENIGLSLKEHAETILFTDINFFDLGNTHPINEKGGFGDPRYQPMKQCLAGLLFSNVKAKTVDTYALGLSLLEAIKALLKQHPSDLDAIAYLECQHLFSRMSASNPQERPSLSFCIQTLEKIALEHQIESDLNVRP